MWLSSCLLGTPSVGTPLYLSWLVHGPPDAPASTDETAAEVAQALKPYETSGDWDGALALLSALEPERAEALHRNDWYRLARALEVAQASEGDGSGAQAETPEPVSPGAGLDIRCIFLSPGDRRGLFHCIDERCEQLVMAGMIQETAKLLLEGSFTAECMAGRAIGYRQAIEYLTRVDYAPGDVEAFQSFFQTFSTATRNYATQQLKWFRKDPRFLFVSVDPSGSDRAEARDQIIEVLALPEADYEVRLTDPQQSKVRQNLVDQGKQMRTYAMEMRHLVASKSSAGGASPAPVCTGSLLETTIAAADESAECVRQSDIPLGVTPRSALARNESAVANSSSASNQTTVATKRDHSSALE